jgi:membrane protein DedA with SNARE-associated domain
MINDLLGTSLSMSMKFNEDIWSAVLLVVIIIACTAGLLWLIYKTPPTSESED